MIDVAAERGRAAGLDNIEFVQRDGEDLQFDSQSYDAVTNAYGLMFCPDPPRALAEAHRVLIPDGRIALVTWDLPSQSAFFTVIRDVAAKFFVLREPAPDEPNPFRLASADMLRSMLEESGFSSVHIDRLTMTFECDSALDYCQIFKDYGWKSKIDALSSDDNAHFHQTVTEAMRPYEGGGRLRLAATSWCVCAQK